MHQRHLLFFVLLFLPLTFFAQTDKRLQGLDKEMQEVLETAKAAGFAVAVVEKDKVIYAKGFGYRDYEKKIPADEHTLFPIGSTTKAFTCGVLGKLRDDKQVAFDESPSKYIPELRFFNDEMNNNVQIRDLMTHMTGLPRHDASWYFFPTNDRNELMRRVQYQEPYAGVRADWYYNNFMFTAQGVIAEKITGKSWEDNVSSLFLKPLKMNRTNFHVNEMQKDSNFSYGYDNKADGSIQKIDFYPIVANGPAGSINSSVTEMANWLKMWINQGKYDGEDILSRKYIRESMTAQSIVSRGLPRDKNPDIHFSTYGYGWFMRSYKGHYQVGHGGNINGFSANAIFYPSDSVGIVVLVNQDASRLPSLVRNIVADRMLGEERSPWLADYKKETKEAEANEKEVSKKEIVLAEKIELIRPINKYIGAFKHKGYGEFEVKEKNDSLFLILKKAKFWLRHKAFDIFEMIDVEDMKDNPEAAFTCQFDNNKLGEIDGVKINFEYALDPIKFEKEIKVIQVDAKEMAQYVGDYIFQGINLKIDIQDEVLHLTIPEQKPYALEAFDEHKFKLKSNGYKVYFVKGKEGAISALELIQPNGTFKAIKK